MTNNKLRTAILQLDLIENNIDFNLEKIRTQALTLKAEQPDLIIIPEIAVEGYNFDYVKTLAQADFARIRAFYSDLAQELNTAIVAGFVEKKGKVYYDSALCLNNEGQELLVYRKMHLWGSESELFTPGTDLDLIAIKGWRIGIAICADAGFPELARSLVFQGADVIIYISAWVKPYDYSWILMCRARACENQIYVIGANRIGATNKAEYCGNSLVVHPSGLEIHNYLEQEGAFMTELSLDEVFNKRKEIPWLQMRKPELYMKG
ncbi:MAG: carbon-nitrogen hydrolase family protein [Saccharofermentanales bacterium]|jgi:omega-amidase